MKKMHMKLTHSKMATIHHKWRNTRKLFHFCKWFNKHVLKKTQYCLKCSYSALVSSTVLQHLNIARIYWRIFIDIICRHHCSIGRLISACRYIGCNGCTSMVI